MNHIKHEEQMQPEAAERKELDKKPYDKPRIIYRGTLEAMAGYCSTSSGGKTRMQCYIASS